MKAKFIGDPAEGDNATIPKVITVHGVAFPAGKFVDVPDEAAFKFEGNSHFETEGDLPEEDDTPAPAKTKAARAKPKGKRVAPPAPSPAPAPAEPEAPQGDE